MTKTLSICCLLLLAGCAKVDPPLSTPKAQAGLNYGHVVVITLDDGTRCAAIDSYYGGGIDCEWRSEHVER